MNDAKIMMKIANCILSQISELQQECLLNNHSHLSSFCEKLENILKNRRLYDMAIQRKWLAASKKIQVQACRNVGDLNYEIQNLKAHLESEVPKTPSVSDVLAELTQIEDEYGQLQYNWEEKTVSVITDPIELEGVMLGSFEIRLYYERISQLCKIRPYHIIALDPRPAASSEDVTHPHVSCEILCEGDGSILIRKALEQGRLADFFDMVIRILNTYNPGSPYVPLNEWHGYPCYDCGYTVDRDESYYCEQCSNDYCSECSSYCKICEATTCLGCLSECSDCHEPVCKDCYGICLDCERRVCNDCLEDQLCYECIENRKDHEDEETIQTTTEHPVAAIQPNSMGQARVSA